MGGIHEHNSDPVDVDQFPDLSDFVKSTLRDIQEGKVLSNLSKQLNGIADEQKNLMDTLKDTLEKQEAADKLESSTAETQFKEQVEARKAKSRARTAVQEADDAEAEAERLQLEFEAAEKALNLKKKGLPKEAVKLLEQYLGERHADVSKFLEGPWIDNRAALARQNLLAILKKMKMKVKKSTIADEDLLDTVLAARPGTDTKLLKNALMVILEAEGAHAGAWLQKNLCCGLKES
eukprot:CAMPEP_0194520506 /NCGR_PEP_ID=MMETSP0253-20130528/54512_1 /TAXON_ID=2966 /ORGANISM="Noctiluca scintillans" /LENGTH=234 /DNA_ID=CAMNT_0039364753 /DNA_START=69 /DNA_END=770 /DNA_ORIENTATION=-